MNEKCYNREDMLFRLNNWRRVYGDHRSQGISITEICCRYARENIRRSKETDEERREREREELENKRPIIPRPDFKDAHILQSVWISLPENESPVPVKAIIRLFTFGTRKEFKQYRRRFGSKMLFDYFDRSLRLFFYRVSDFERIISQPVANDENFS